jgi:hypothetical protein
LYALVALSDSSAVVLKGGVPSTAAIASVGTSAPGTSDTMITASYSYGALPATFPTVAYSTSNVPLLTLRYGV